MRNAISASTCRCSAHFHEPTSPPELLSMMAEEGQSELVYPAEEEAEERRRFNLSRIPSPDLVGLTCQLLSTTGSDVSKKLAELLVSCCVVPIEPHPCRSNFRINLWYRPFSWAPGSCALCRVVQAWQIRHFFCLASSCTQNKTMEPHHPRALHWIMDNLRHVANSPHARGFYACVYLVIESTDYIYGCIKGTSESTSWA